jgi:hypothetical protein
MDFYTFSLLLGGAGLGTMAIGGFVQHGSGHDGAHSGGHHHPGGDMPATIHSAVHSSAHSVAHAPAQGVHSGGAEHGIVSSADGHPGVFAHLAVLVSPRVLFGVLLGLGTAGLLLSSYLGGALRFSVALVLAFAFERLFMTPLWNFVLGFASQPASTLETAISSEATAVTAFDANGQGIVRIELDGQVVQVLATLTSRDRALGHRVRAGEGLRVEEVDAERNRCSVTLL